jgi:hypothetical protein
MSINKDNRGKDWPLAGRSGGIVAFVTRVRSMSKEAGRAKAPEFHWTLRDPR